MTKAMADEIATLLSKAGASSSDTTTLTGAMLQAASATVAAAQRTIETQRAEIERLQAENAALRAELGQ
jgi:hypothetical protein